MRKASQFPSLLACSPSSESEELGNRRRGERGRMQKVILLGLDGASYNVIQPWVEEGQLPAFARLLREGSHGVLPIFAQSTFG